MDPRDDVPAALAGLQTRLQRYARTQLRNEAMAEDAVSETMLALLVSTRRFDSHAQATAWLFGVLKHKLVDQLRQQHRETPAGDMVDETDAAAASWAGAWHGVVPPDGQDPEAACRSREFVALVARLCGQLPATQARAFQLRELLDMDTPTVCHSLGVTDGHLCVLIHRARKRLQQDLQDWRN